MIQIYKCNSWNGNDIRHYRNQYWLLFGETFRHPFDSNLAPSYQAIDLYNKFMIINVSLKITVTFSKGKRVKKNSASQLICTLFGFA